MDEDVTQIYVSIKSKMGISKSAKCDSTEGWDSGLLGPFRKNWKNEIEEI